MSKTMNACLQEIAEAKESGDLHRAKWLTACWMPYAPEVRSAAWAGDAKPHSVAEPASLANIVQTDYQPVKRGKLVFIGRAAEILGLQSEPKPSEG